MSGPASLAQGPVISTERFDLWQPRADDLDALCRLTEDEETRRFLGPSLRGRQPQFERLLRNAGSWSLYGYGTFFVRQKGVSEGDFIASCGLFRSFRGFGPAMGLDDVIEAGWIVRRDWWGKGLAGEVMAAVLAWFDAKHRPERIACMIEEGNLASERVAARLGFRRYAIHEMTDGESTVRLNLFERQPR